MTSPSLPSADTSLAARLPAWALALAGAGLTALAGNRGGSSLLAWVAPVALALAAVRLQGRRGRLALLVACVAGLSLQSLKMVTPPVTPAFALLFGVPLGLLAWLTLVLWDALRRRAPAAWSIPAYAALAALADVAGLALSPAGAWATTAASHAEDLPLLQLAALGGLGLVGLAVGLGVGAAAALLAAPAGRRPWRTALTAACLLAAAHAWGSLRLQAAHEGPTLRVAGVTVDFPARLTSMEDLRGAEDLLLERTATAARRGAELVIWNEVATLVDAGAEEAALVARAAEAARRHGIDLVIGYGAVLSRDPFLIDNVAVWLDARGEVLQRYQKHALPPGEPTRRGTAPLEVLERPWGRSAVALCYDYDFPALARAHARGGAGLVALPSSDWAGIDPQHTFMARARAIEGGFSLIRAARASTSMAFDAHGRVRAAMPAREANERIMLATVPVTRVPTLYAATGDGPVLLLAAALLAGALAAARRSRRAPRAEAEGAAAAA